MLVGVYICTSLKTFQEFDESDGTILQEANISKILHQFMINEYEMNIGARTSVHHEDRDYSI